MFCDQYPQCKPHIKFTSSQADFYTGGELLAPDLTKMVPNSGKYTTRGMLIGYARTRRP